VTYLFQPALDKMRRKGYAALSENERQQWHADVYGFRRVALDQWQQTSPVDETGTYFDSRKVDIAEKHYRRKFNKPAPKPWSQPSPEDVAYVEQLVATMKAPEPKRMVTYLSDLHAKPIYGSDK
jgi:hypothetical protein